jgi:hypothetical protein
VASVVLIFWRLSRWAQAALAAIQQGSLGYAILYGAKE